MHCLCLSPMHWSICPRISFSISEVDEEGNIWFIIPRPTQVLNLFLRKCRPNSTSLKKARISFLKISGLASIAWSTDELKCPTLAKQFSGFI